jgi:desulfoferrodoxin
MRAPFPPNAARPWVVIGAELVAVLMVAACSPKGVPPQTAPPGPVKPPVASATDKGAPDAASPRTAADPKHMTELEAKHVPQFDLPAKLQAGQAATVVVKVGRVAHPMVATHYIQWVELYVDSVTIGRVALKPGDAPEARFEITPGKSTSLKAVISCNVHGLWQNTIQVQAGA